MEFPLEDMEDLVGVDDEWLSGEFQGVEECENELLAMIRQGEKLLMRFFERMLELYQLQGQTEFPSRSTCRKQRRGHYGTHTQSERSKKENEKALKKSIYG